MSNPKRRKRNKRRREDLLRPRGGPPRVRRTFSGKSRSGDAVELALIFSGETIFTEEDRPVESLNEIHEKTKDLVSGDEQN